jgi:aspartokinase/homoserine dehydrogenase 1
MSSQLMAAAFNAHGVVTAWKDSRELIKTNSNFTNAQVDFAVTDKNLQNYLATNTASVVLLPGFIASDANNVNTTLGRGGSDYTAAIAAAAVHADSIEIWTDVSGMMTADPRFVQNVKVIPSISYQEAMELSHFGAKVIYPPTIQPVLSKGIPVWVKNTFAPDDYGTIIETNAAASEHLIRGITSINNMALISLEGSGMIGVPGFSKRLFEALSNDGINVILITQGSSEHSICVGVEAASAVKAKATVDLAFANEIALQKVEPLIVETDLSIIALVGENMKSHQGISGKMFGVLGRNGVNIRAIAQGSSERNISAVIATKDVRKAVNVLHEEFFETTYKQLNLFIAGVGNVGGRFVEQLQQQQQYLKDHLQLQVNVVGLANSRQALINEDGIDLSNWKESLAAAPALTIGDFVQAIINRNLRNTVFADVTANGDVAKVYDQLLSKSIAVVACNKVAASSEYSYYKKLKNLAREYNTSFLFETNVGAGLPIIGTLNDLTRTGDTVNKMQAVLSGTLNFVFNNYDGTKTFAEVVKQAQEEGYTEPDPRLDLNGSDVMRKIMILAREAGHKIEMADISNNSFMPSACMQGSVADFYENMKKYESHFKQLLEEAKTKGCILKFVAQFDNGKASVGLQHIDPQHNLYHLYGKDNIVLFYTDRYKDQPLVVKGAGAGAEVTASGVFADIMRAV